MRYTVCILSLSLPCKCCYIELFLSKWVVQEIMCYLSWPRRRPKNGAILQPCLFMSPLLGAKFYGPELLCCSCVSLAGFHGDTHGCSLSAPTQSVVGTAQRNFALWLFAGSASFT